MPEDPDLRGRVEALEVQIERLLASAEPASGATNATRPSDDHPEGPSSLSSLTRRGLLSAAAGAVAGGAAATLANPSDAALDTHIKRASAAHDAASISVTPTGELVATDVRGALTDLDGRLASLLQFSPDYLQDYAFFYDDFFGGSITTGQIGTMGWQVATANGGTLASATSSVANMPGWYVLLTGAATSNGLCALHHEEVSLHGHPLFVWEVRVATRLLNEGGHGATWRAGLHDDVSGVEPTNGFYFEYTAAGDTLHCRTAKSGARADIDSGVVLAAQTAYRLRIISDGGGTAYFYVDSALVATFSRDLPSAVDESFGPALTIAKTVGTGQTRSIAVDYAYLLWSVAR